MHRSYKKLTSRILLGKYGTDMTRIVILASAVLIFSLIGLYLSCAYPGMFGRHSNGFSLINSGKAAAPFVSPRTSLQDIAVNRTMGYTTEGHPKLPDSNHISPSEDNSSDLKFVVQMHGHQCLVHSLKARSFQGDGASDITWVTQLTIDRLPLLRSTLERWGGPVSAALYSQVSGTRHIFFLQSHFCRPPFLLGFDTL